ncbi:hypothetical protein DMN91_011528 [Ooceraea biroi]|uniref:Spaetzle domain-containing protein n=2 Tax=Ooceraea biroi TaxID=2015173 RepID=A0A3L8D5L7_OOCBI|nr:hypothetical protein DMN91_011528 [Ooceraea biroi]
MPGIRSQTRHKQQPLWTSLYNGQVNVRPMGVMGRPPLPIAFYNGYPYIFSDVLNSNNIPWKPYIPNFRPQNDKSTMFGNQWFNPGHSMGNGIKINNNSNMTNVRYVPVVMFLPVILQPKTQQAHSTKQDSLLPETMMMPGNQHSSGVNNYISTTESSQDQQEEEDNSEEESMSEMTEANRDSLSDEDITRLIEQALQNGELLNRDEWWKKYTAMKRKQFEEFQELLEGNKDNQQSPNLQHDLHSLLSPPPACSNSTFCERVVNYPEELVNQAIRNNESLKLLQKTDHVPNVEKLYFGETDDWPLCHSSMRTIYPRSAKTVTENWLYVINQNNFQQGIRVEVCVNEGSVCDDLENYVPEGYKVFCKQNYILRELMAVNNDGTIGKNNFKLPSNCCCHREFVGAN